MPMLPNTSDVDSKAVNPENAILPGSEGINSIEREVEAPNYVEKKPDIVAEVTPPSNFVSNKLNQFGESTNNARKIDVEFEQYIAGREKQIQPKERQKQIEADKARFISMSDNIFSKEVDQLKGMDSTRKQALYGVADFAQEVENTAAEFRNTARRLFNMSEFESVPDYASMLPEPKTPQEEFVRSSTKFLTGMLPISKTFKAVTGVVGVANSLASSGIYGFLFDDNQTEGLVNTLIQENFDIAPDILDYMNHKTDDSKFITRLKNSANYVADDLAFEGIFQGLKMARSLSKGRSQAYKVLENGDVEVKSKKVGETDIAIKSPNAITDEMQRFERRSSLAFDQVPASFDSADFAPELESVRNNHWVRKTFDKAGKDVLDKYISIYENLDPKVQNMMEQYQKNQYGSKPGPIEMGGEITRGTNSLGTWVGSAVQQRLYNDTFKQILDKELPIKAGPKTQQLIKSILDEDVRYIEDLNKLWKLPTDSGDVLKYVDELNTASKAEAGMPQWAKDIVGYRDGVVKVLKKANPKQTEKSLLESATDFVKKVVSSDFRIKGLTTEDVGKKSTKDLIEEEIALARADIQKKYDLKQEANPERLTQGRDAALKEIEKNPMSLKQLLAIKENEPVNNLVVMQSEIAQNALARVGKRIADKVSSGKEDPELALYKLKNISDAMDRLSFPRSTSGRSLESAKFISKLDETDALDTEKLSSLNKIFGQDAKTIFDEYRLSQDNLAGFPFIDSVLQGMRKTVDPKKMRQYVTTARINWILSDPTIHTANVSSNTLTMGLRSATELTAAGVTKARSILGNKYLAKGVAFNEANATVNGYMTGLSKGFKIIADNIAIAAKDKTLSSPDFRAIYSRDSNTKYNMAIDKIIAESDAANNFENATLGKQIVQVLAHTVAGTPVGKMLSWEDDFFKGMHYMAEVNKQLTIDENNIARNASTYSDAAESQAYTAREMARVNRIRENFKKGILDEDIDKQARDAANYWTFNSELVGDDAITNLLKAGEVGRNKSEILRWFIPFYRTGANIANMSLEYTPVIGGILKMKNAGGFAGLARGGREADTFIAKQVIGSTVMATAATLYMQLEDTFGIDFQMSSLKNNKVGVKIGDVEFGVDKQNPTLKLFIATRDIMDIANIAQQAEGASSAAMSAAALFMEMYSPEQMIQTLGTLSDITSGPAKDIPSKLQNMLKSNVLSQVTPYSGLARFANRDVKGMTKVNMGQERGEDLIDEMMKRFTHLYLGDDANIPVRRGIFGQEIPYLRTLGYSVSDNAHDMLAGYDLNEPVVKEIFRLTREDVMTNPNNYDSFELNNTTILKMPTRSITLPTGESYELTPREYSDYVKISAGDHPSFNGRTLKSTLEGYVQTEGYQKLPDAFKTTAIKDIVNLYRKAAKGILLKDNVDIMIEGREALIRLKREYINVK